jgi:hypothetical protein
MVTRGKSDASVTGQGNSGLASSRAPVAAAVPAPASAHAIQGKTEEGRSKKKKIGLEDLLEEL